MSNVSREPGQTKGERTDLVLKGVVVLLVAAVLGLAAFFAYTVWQSRQIEETSTPAQRALAGLRDFVRKNPNSAAGRVRYGEALGAAGKYDESVEQLKIAVKLDPKHTGAYLDLGIVAMIQDDRRAAEGYFTKVVDLTEGVEYQDINARREQALFHLGEIAVDAKRYEDAAGFFKAAIRIKKDSSDSYFLLATALHELGSDDEALEQLEAATAFDPNYPEAHYLWGTILMSKGDDINAAVHLRKALDLAPDSKLAKDALAKLGTAEDAVRKSAAALAAGDADEAIDLALLARQLDPQSVDAAIAHLKAVVEKGDTKAAKEIAAEALELDPKNAEVKQIKDSLK